jgi:poly-gamma-glutamate synthesis protein (capsule biosynthesis protein)
MWDVRPLYAQDTVTIRFFGDIMMHTNQIETAESGNGSHDFGTYYTLMEDYLEDSDLNAANMEFTLGGEPYTGYPSFSAPDSYATYLADAGFNVFLCANNHIFDKGNSGVKRTLGIYERLIRDKGIHFTGTAMDEISQSRTTPLIINTKGIRTAFINATYGTNSPRGNGWPKTNIISDRESLSKALNAAETKADVTIVLVHWGAEYSLQHSESQEKEAKWFAENGADLIIGTHPHVIQDADTLVCDGKDVPVVYSLGNSVSNMSAANTQAGLMVTARIVRKSNGDIQVLSPEYKYTWCSRPGGYGNSYYVIPITDFLDRKNEWKGQWDYDKMLTTYRRVGEITGIKEKTDK